MINEELIKQTEQTEWDFVNEILYKMCKENFTHEHTDKIVGKVILIGRAYAAAIERRKNKTEQNDNFILTKLLRSLKTQN